MARQGYEVKQVDAFFDQAEQRLAAMRAEQWLAAMRPTTRDDATDGAPSGLARFHAVGP
jgi:hypothetical protein